ncbi:MAG: hypothetical protein NZ108_03350 [Bacteroidia bacterium]|nr:hypothetical protein [Bacteroidia bacterium]
MSLNSWRTFIWISYWLFVFISCKKSHHRLDNTDLPTVTLDIKRIDLILAKAAAEIRSGQNDSIVIYRKYFAEDKPFWLEFLFDTTLTDEQIAGTLFNFCKDTNTVKLLNTVQNHFPENYDFVGKLTPSMRRFKAIYPMVTIPKFRFVVTGFPQFTQNPLQDQLLLSDEYCVISLEYFLGDDFHYPLDMPKYVQRRCRAEFLPVAILQSFLSKQTKPINLFQNPPMLEFMIHRGKMYYQLEEMLPEISDSVLIAYADSNFRFCQTFEAEIYNELMPLLYSTDHQKYSRFLDDKPFTPGFDRSSPGRLGHWIGWQIVRAYMRKHSEITIQALLTKPYQEIFKESGYKP